MKKLCLILACILLVAAVGMTAFAADSAQVTIDAAETTVRPGDTVTVSAKISPLEACQAAGVALEYDKAVFEFTQGKCMLKGVALSDVSDGVGVFSYGGTEAVSGEIFTFQLKVKEGAAFGKYSITATVGVRDSQGEIPATVAPLEITVAQSVPETPAPQAAFPWWILLVGGAAVVGGIVFVVTGKKK